MAEGYLNTPANSPGFFIGADPDWQAKQLQLGAATAFQHGLPTDASGQPDFGAMARTLIQKGDLANGINLLQTGIQQAGVRAALDAANQLGGSAPAPAPNGSGAPMTPFRNAISGLESNGNYGALGPVNPKSGDKPYGRYQVMGANIGPWTKQVLGQEMTPQQFLASPDAQDKVFDGIFGGYLKQYGPAGAASMWHSGRPDSPNVADSNGTRTPQYVSRFLAGLPRGGGGQTAPASVASSAPPQAAPVQVAQNGTDDAAPSSDHPYATPAPVYKPFLGGGTPAPVRVAGPGEPPQPSPDADASQTSPPSAVDPSLGGLLKGKFVGDPGGYISNLRAQAVRLGALGQTGAASAYNAQATLVENALTRSETPEIKNYATAIRQGYKGTMMDFAKDTAAQAETAKLAAQGDPSAIRAAGQRAQAEADARASSQAAAASQIAEQQQQGEALGKLPGTLATAADNARLQQNLVDEMLTASDGFRMGPGATTQQNLNNKLVALGDAIGVDTSGLKKQVGSFTDFAKLSGQLTRQSIKETGSSRAGIQEMQMVAGSLPSPDMNKDGFRTVANQLSGLGDFTIAKQQAAQAWNDQHHTMAGFETDWNKNVTPAAFVLHRLQVDQPDLFRQTVKTMSQTPQGRAALGNVKNGLTWGAKAGLF